jgi:hypothetical protein
MSTGHKLYIVWSSTKMKIGRYAVALMAACILSLVFMAAAHAQENGEVFDLAITEIEVQPFSAGIGEETKYFTTIENLFAPSTSAYPDLDLLLTVSNAQDEIVIASCRQPLNLSLLASGYDSLRVAVVDCSVVLQKPGTHLVRAELVESGQTPDGPDYAPIPGDLNSANNGRLTTIVPVVNENDTYLPTELTRIFAGLAIFFAVMALVAAGTEVAIDSVKVAVGLKSKVTSMDALDRMEKYMPGELGALSVSATTQEEFRRMIREMRSSLGATLVAVQSLAALREQISASEFGAYFQRADEIGLANNSLAGKELYNYKKYLQAYVTNVLNTLENRLHLTAQSVQALRDQLAQEISLFDGREPNTFLSDLLVDLQDPHFWSTQIIDGWLNEERDTFFARSGSAVIEEYDNEVKPVLAGVGFTRTSIDSLRQEIITRLDLIESGMSQSTDTFLTSIRNVLDAVELRRYDTQSPSRKLWRKLRGWREGTFPPTRLRATVLPAVFLALIFLFVARIKHMTDTSPLGSTPEGVVPWMAWFLIFFLFAFSLMLLLFFFRRSIGAEYKLWFIGLYGAAALSLSISAMLTFLLWILQPGSANRVSGEIQLLDWTQPWWVWLIIFMLVIMAGTMIASLIAKYVYDRLVRSAIKDGRLNTDSDLLANATVLHRVETLWNLMRQGFDVTRVNPALFDKPDSVADYEDGNLSPSDRSFLFTPETAAQFIMQRTDQQRDEETSRLRILRVLSIIVGLVIAYALQIDVLNLLGEAFPDIMEQLNWTVISGETLHAWRTWLPVDKSITVGIVLTAFAASAGSAFWHDRLDQLQASKKGAQAAAQLLNQASQVVDGSARN